MTCIQSTSLVSGPAGRPTVSRTSTPRPDRTSKQPRATTQHGRQSRARSAPREGARAGRRQRGRARAGRIAWWGTRCAASGVMEDVSSDELAARFAEPSTHMAMSYVQQSLPTNSPPSLDQSVVSATAANVAANAADTFSGRRCATPRRMMSTMMSCAIRPDIAPYRYRVSRDTVVRTASHRWPRAEAGKLVTATVKAPTLFAVSMTEMVSPVSPECEKPIATDSGDGTAALVSAR